MAQYYHVTLKSNVESIYTDGLLPDKATGKEAKVWLVDARMIYWAIVHCALRHNVTVDQLVVIPVYAGWGAVSKTRWVGVFTSNFKLHANNHPSDVAAIMRTFDDAAA